jgi:16S rRNA (guanine527-N7)-methyltransferase
MSPTTAATAAILSAELGTLGVPATAEQLEQLARFAEELLRWNEKINLTAARTLDEVVQHIVDSAAIVAHIPATTQRVIDVGSGGGLPCAVIAILRPEVEVTALEPVHKKHAFLSQVRRLLCPNLVPLAERVEAHAGRGYDVATSRATFALADWLAIGRRLVRPGGRVLGMEGADRGALPDAAARHPYPIAGKTRAIIVLDSEPDAREPVGD